MFLDIPSLSFRTVHAKNMSEMVQHGQANSVRLFVRWVRHWISINTKCRLNLLNAHWNSCSISKMWRVKKVVNSMIMLRMSWGIIIFEVMYVVIVGPGRNGLLGRPMFLLGLAMSLMMLNYRSLKRRFGSDPLTKRKNIWETMAVTLISLTLILVLRYAMPKVRDMPNPNFDASLGPVLVENCVYDYAEGSICGEKDMNPESLPRGENLVLGAIAVTGIIYFMLYTQVPKRIRKITV